MQTRVVAGRYELARALGRGGMGTVWLGEDRLTGRQVAVKELRAPDGMSPGEREVFGKRALQEARSAARIQHPNAVTLYDVVPASADDDAVHLVMEYVDGATLAQVIQRDGSLTGRQATGIALQLLSVLEAAHGLGVVHRDIKPGNIMITAGGQVKLADFGIAHTAGDTRLTGSGVIGTPSYMAPELFEAQAITPAVDVWSLGATLYHAVEGRGPFDRESTGAVLRAVLMDPLPAIGTPGPLATAITGMLTRDPARRITIPQARQLLEVPPRPATHPVTQPAGHATPAAPGQRQPNPFAWAWRRLGPSSMRGRHAVKFTNAPGGRRREQLQDVGGLLIIAACLIDGAITHFHDEAFVIPVFIVGGIAVLVNLPYSYLTVSPRGLEGWRHGSKHAIAWHKIARIGPVTEDGRTYLYAWGNGLSPANRKKRPVRLCPLGQPHFPPAEIRAAILKYHPDAAIDPM